MGKIYNLYSREFSRQADRPKSDLKKYISSCEIFWEYRIFSESWSRELVKIFKSAKQHRNIDDDSKTRSKTLGPSLTTAAEYLLLKILLFHFIWIQRAEHLLGFCRVILFEFLESLIFRYLLYLAPQHPLHQKLASSRVK